MAKTREQKQEILSKFKQSLDKAKSVVFATFSGVSVKEQEEMRSKFREKDVLCVVLKKTLLKKAMEDKAKDLNGFDEWVGNILVAISEKDEVVTYKVSVQADKDIEGFKVKAGFLEGKIIDTKTVLSLSKLPGKDELIAKVVGSIRAPLFGFVNVLQGNQRSLINVLNQIKESK